MSDTNQLLLLLAAARQQQQQQQQQQAIQAQLAKLQKALQPTTSSAASTPKPSTSSASSNISKNAASSVSDLSASGGSQIQNAALAQQIAQIAQFGALMAAQKKQQQEKEKEKEKVKASTSTTSTAMTVPGMSPEMLLMWQQSMQLQAIQQMMLANPKNQMEEAIKKMMDMAKKKPAATAASVTSSAAPVTSSASTPDASMMNTVMWQLVAQQMQQNQQKQQQKEQQLQKESQKKAEQLKKAKELAKKQQKEQDARNRQQEEVVKFLMAQHQLTQQKKQEETAALDAVLATRAAAARTVAAQEGGEAMIRLPLQLGWRRQTCVRSIAASGVRGDVSYFAPCGKKLGTYSEVVRYLTKNGIFYLSRENFSFTTKMIIGEFIVPKPSESDDTRQEREFLMMTEDDVNKELARLTALKSAPKVVPSTSTVVTPEEEVKPSPIVPDEPEELLDPAELNDDFAPEEAGTATSSGVVEECKIREREADDLLVNNSDARHLPEFTRIGNQCLTSQGFADALMVHEFVQNFGHVLGIDLSKSPKLESLCAGLAGDAQKADSFLQLARQLLRLALEFPGMGNEKRFGQGGGEMGLDRENFSEVMRLFLVDKGKRGEELSAPLLTTNFVALRGEQKAAILAFLCDELVCSRNVVTEIDRNLDEISRLRGEKWMREGKARALKSARSKKCVQSTTDQHNESDSEPPTRPMTPKNAATALISTASPLAPAVPILRKFTPGLGQCEVLTEQEEAMSQEQMDDLIGELQQEAHVMNQKIHDAGLRIRSFPFGTDRFHRNFWILPHTDAVLVESLATTSANNPACNVQEIASKDPPLLEQRVSIDNLEGLDLDVIGCVEDLVDEVVLTRAKADKKIRKRYRRVDNQAKRGWWTMPSRESVEPFRTALLTRGIRERALHRLLSKPWFLNEMKFGTITLDPIGEKTDLTIVEKQGWSRLEMAIDKLQRHLKMADVAKNSTGEQKPTVVPTSMALAQIVKDDVEWKMLEVKDTSPHATENELRQKIIQTSEMVDSKFWRPRFRAPEPDENDKSVCELYEDWKLYVLTEASTSSQLMVALQALEGMIMWERSAREALCQICKSMDGDEMLVCDGCESGCHMECFRSVCELYEDWKLYVLTEASTSSQLMVALQALEGMIMWERSAREALCQICKSMDGDEMLVCDGCESGCHMECFRPRITKVPEGDWFCQRCREEKSGKPMCMFCSRESGILFRCQRCAYHVHQDCAQDGPKETIQPKTFICPHCQEMKQMRFVKRVMLRGESEERENDEEDHEHHKNGNGVANGHTVVAGANATAHLNGHAGHQNGGSHQQNGGTPRTSVKRKMEPSMNGGLPISMNKELCQLMLDELVMQQHSFPFLEPVNPKLVPGYKMVIVKPMDLSTIRTKNEKLSYETPEDFAEDIELMFANCRQFNIDHSEIGRAGINLHKFYQKRWKQLKYNFTKRLRRLHRHS
uniref:Histone acetyltransferase n=1 Tax=Caenorhabditis japonica TaxID=281687 RepID=A0A8R1E0G7_CAEJA